MESPFRIEASSDRGASLLSLFGELDVASSSELEAALERADRNGPVIIDLRGLEFIDSTGLGLLVRTHQRLASAGGLVLIKGEGQVDRLLELTGIGDQLRVVTSLDRAIASEG